MAADVNLVVDVDVFGDVNVAVGRGIQEASHVADHANVHVNVHVSEARRGLD